MFLRNAAEIDKNFSTSKSVQREGLTYYNAENFDVYGVKRVDGIYRRMQYSDAMAISEKIALISSECAGGRVRFATDSPYLAITDVSSHKRAQSQADDYYLVCP